MQAEGYPPDPHPPDPPRDPLAKQVTHLASLLIEAIGEAARRDLAVPAGVYDAYGRLAMWARTLDARTAAQANGHDLEHVAGGEPPPPPSS